jgi:hypothetical protein
MASPVRSEDWRAQSKVKTGNTDLLPLVQLGRVLAIQSNYDGHKRPAAQNGSSLVAIGAFSL